MKTGNVKPQIDELRADGFKVQIEHFRRYKLFDTNKRQMLKGVRLLPPRDAKVKNGIVATQPLPRGGVTWITATKNGKECQVKVDCHKKDIFNKKTAVKVGLGRLRKCLNS